MSKFTYEMFFNENGDGYVAVSKQKYSKEQAIEIAKKEFETNKIKDYGTEMFVRYGLGVLNGEKRQCYWLEERKTRREKLPVKNIIIGGMKCLKYMILLKI